MAITSGFYNALNHDRQYEATQIGSIFDGIIEDGIYETIGQKLMVTASGNGLVVNVGTGRAWFDHTWTLNDAILPIEMDEAELVLDRIDAVVLEVDASLSGRTNAVKTVKGTPSSNPVKPTLINTEEVHQYPLAWISIKAEQTLVEQSDIENAVGTSSTPFVIGVLEMMNVDALIAQWQTQFENMMRDDQQDFTNWEVLVKAAYEAWFDGVKDQMEHDIDEFKGWEQTTKTTFDAWFQNLQDELDDNQAAHLQRQIGTLPFLTTTNKDNLVAAINEVNAKASASISEILIDYDPASLTGATVTLTHTASAEGHTPETYTITLDDSGEMEVDVSNLGHWTITENVFGTTTELEIHYFGYYHVNIGGDIFINVAYADDFADKVIYCTNSDQTKTYHKTAGAVGETVQFCLNDEGTWTIYSTVSGQRYETSVTVVHDHTYNIELNTVPDGSTVLPTDDIQILLHCANIWDKSYSAISELLADSTSLLTVISSNNAVDYLVRSTTWTTDVCADSIAMTDIGANNYCSGTLLADSTWKYAICNSTYFESVLNTKVPTMTSNTAPSGTCSASSSYNTSYDAYCAFNTSKYGWSPNGSDTSKWIQYQFDTAVKVYELAIRVREGMISGPITISSSSDGSEFTQIGNTSSGASATTSYIYLTPISGHSYYRVTTPSINTSRSIYLQLYGRTDV